jgi:hypothetical protein
MDAPQTDLNEPTTVMEEANTDDLDLDLTGTIREAVEESIAALSAPDQQDHVLSTVRLEDKKHAAGKKDDSIDMGDVLGSVQF